jgi:hypothetical protein
VGVGRPAPTSSSPYDACLTDARLLSSYGACSVSSYGRCARNTCRDIGQEGQARDAVRDALSYDVVRWLSRLMLRRKVSTVRLCSGASWETSLAETRVSDVARGTTTASWQRRQTGVEGASQGSGQGPDPDLHLHRECQ